MTVRGISTGHGMTSISRIGIDLGGTKISGVRLGSDGTPQDYCRVDTPRYDYRATIDAISTLVETLTDQNRDQHRLGIGIPGSISPMSGRVQNANSTWLNGKPFQQDLEQTLGVPVRVANDANCFAMSEAIDGAAVAYSSVFGVILGTGCGGGFVYNKQIVDGPRSIGGEWGHTPLPAPEADELPGPDCWCGRQGCIETWVSGSGLTADHKRNFGQDLSASDISANAANGCVDCATSLERHASRLARGLAVVINILDPDCIVLGGGLSNLQTLYAQLPGLIAPHIFAENQNVTIVPPLHGDDSGVRGAAWLWND